MRFLKRQTTNKRNTLGHGFNVLTNLNAVVDLDTALLIPKGTTAQRPSTTEEGQIRYNTDINTIELFRLGVWKKVSLREPKPIIQQSVGSGDGIETVFGPLNNQDSDYPVPTSAQCMIVLIENVYQIATTNYTLEQSSAGNLAGPSAPYADGWYIKFTNPVPNGKPVTVIHNFDK